jgi:hypothetical protein
MIKRSLVYGGVAALAAAILIFAGCSQATDSDNSSVPAVTPDGVVVDRTVASGDLLIRELADPEVDVVAFVLGESDPSITATIIIPAGKTVYLLNYGNELRTLTPTKGLEVRGTLIVSESTALKAAGDGKVYLGNSGSLQIQAGGELITDKLKGVSDLTDAGVAVDTVLGKSRIRYAGGSALTITDEAGLAVDGIKALLSDITPAAGSARSVAGQVTGSSTLALEAVLTNIKPSDIYKEFGALISGNRAFTVKPGKTETESSITIPAGARITIKADDLLTTVGELIVEGVLEASAATGDTTKSDGIKITVGPAGEAKVEKIEKVTADSKVAAGGKLKGPAEIPVEKGAIINGLEVSDEGKITLIPPFTGNAGALTVAEGTALITTTIPQTATGVTIPAGATLLIPEGVTLTIDGNVDSSGTPPSTFTLAGTIKVGGTLIVNTGVPALGGFTGAIEVEKGGVLWDKKTDGGSFWGDAGVNNTPPASNGVYVYRAGALIKIDTGAGDDVRIGPVDSGAKLQLASGTLTLKRTEQILDGTADVGTTVGVAVSNTLTITSGSVLTVSADAEDANAFTITGKAIVNGRIIGKVPGTSKLKIAAGGSITFGSGVSSNFYANGASTATATPAADKVYNWKTISGKDVWEAKD